MLTSRGASTEQAPHSIVALQEAAKLNKACSYFADVACAQARTQIARTYEIVSAGAANVFHYHKSTLTETDQNVNVDIYRITNSLISVVSAPPYYRTKCRSLVIRGTSLGLRQFT